MQNISLLHRNQTCNEYQLAANHHMNPFLLEYCSIAITVYPPVAPRVSSL